MSGKRATAPTLASVSLGSVALIGAVSDYRISLIVASLMVAFGALFCCVVVLPGVWSRKETRRDAALQMATVLSHVRILTTERIAKAMSATTATTS
jgi:hypothetical protein